MNRNRSVVTIDEPEFINVKPYNPTISKCEIKVLYVGKNRNGSYITKDVAIQMANSLPCTPIVGAFREDVEDFGDHGHVMHLENGEIKFSCKTRPYGFVAPDAEIWFQKFNDYDEFGNVVEREYLMTTGYLWTSQYEEALSCVQGGKGQSMELDSETIEGHWATDNNSGVEFFIINDAIFTKLCILGDDVEPCFEGASIKAPEVSAKFTRDKDFENTLFSMMNDLKYALQNKGGSDMPNEFEEIEEPISEEATVEFEADSGDSGEPGTADGVESETEGSAEDSNEESNSQEESSDGEDTTEESSEDDEEGSEEGPVSEDAEELINTDVEEPRKKIQDFAKEDEKKDEEPEDKEDESSEEEDEEKKKEVTEAKCGGSDKEKPSKHSLEQVEAEFAALKEEYEKLQSEYTAAIEELQSLNSFKLEIENQQKDAIINKYFMLDDSDKANVIEHKSEYTCEEIEQKLALIYVQKNVDFSSVEENEVEEKETASIFSVDTAAEISFAGHSGLSKALLAARQN